VRNPKRKDVFWFILLRLIILSALAIAAISIQFSAPDFLPLNSFYYLLGLWILLSIIYFILYGWGKHITIQVYFQIVLDLIFITGLVYIFGGLRGSFYFLYIFEIIAASIVLSNRASYITASLSAIFFGVLLDINYLGLIPYSSQAEGERLTLGLVINNIVIAWSVFFLVAFLINYLSDSLRKARKELQSTQKQLEVRKNLAIAGEVAANLAHEIRNPLAAISGSVQVLKNELNLTGENKDLMEIVVKESTRVSQSIEQFLNLAASGDVEFYPIDLSQILTETLFLLQRSGEWHHKFQVKGNYESSKMSIYGNNNQFKQVFWNIIKNAIKAMPDGGILTIDFEQTKKNEIQMKFTDTGKGMKKEDKDRLFELFYSGFKQGNGIGMSIVRRIIDDYNGKIEVFSEPDKGTEIMITLPQGSLEKG
jgi:two-component system sensor histidine kinase PilS (NtrC family)